MDRYVIIINCGDVFINIKSPNPLFELERLDYEGGNETNQRT